MSPPNAPSRGARSGQQGRPRRSASPASRSKNGGERASRDEEDRDKAMRVDAMDVDKTAANTTAEPNNLHKTNSAQNCGSEGQQNTQGALNRSKTQPNVAGSDSTTSSDATNHAAANTTQHTTTPSNQQQQQPSAQLTHSASPTLGSASSGDRNDHPGNGATGGAQGEANNKDGDNGETNPEAVNMSYYHDSNRELASVNVDEFADQADEVELEEPEEAVQTGPKYHAVHYWPRVPTFPWPHSEIPDPSRPDTVGISAHRFRYEGSLNRVTDGREDLRTTLHNQIMVGCSSSGITHEAFSVRPPIRRGNTTYIDVLVFDKRFYNTMKGLVISCNNRPVRHVFSGAPLEQDQIVLRVDVDIRIKTSHVAERVRNTVRGLVDITDIWGMHSEKGAPGLDYRLEFEGIIYFLGKLKRRNGFREIPPVVDLSGIEWGFSKKQILHFTNRPNYCTACRNNNNWHTVEQCPRHATRCKICGTFYHPQDPCFLLLPFNENLKY